MKIDHVQSQEIMSVSEATKESNVAMSQEKFDKDDVPDQHK